MYDIKVFIQEEVMNLAFKKVGFDESLVKSKLNFQDFRGSGLEFYKFLDQCIEKNNTDLFCSVIYRFVLFF